MVTKNTYCRAVALLLVVACATHEDNAPSLRDAHVADAIGALQSAVDAMIVSYKHPRTF